MNRRWFLGLLGLAGCRDINEDCMNIKKKIWWMGAANGSGSDWILATTDWRDTGIWIDGETWND